MAKSIKELMKGTQRGKRQSSYVQGNISPTHLTKATSRSDIGKGIKGSSFEISEFMNALLDSAPSALDAHNRMANKENKELIEEGKAAYKNATPELLQKFREGEKLGVLGLADNPFHLEGVHTEELKSQAITFGRDFAPAYEKWRTGKTPDDPQTYQGFVDKFMNEASMFETRHDSSGIHRIQGLDDPNIAQTWFQTLSARDSTLVKDNFWPKADAVIDKYRADHIGYESKKYRNNTQRTIETARFQNVDTQEDVSNDLDIGTDTLGQRIAIEDVRWKEWDNIDLLMDGVLSRTTTFSLESSTAAFTDMLNEVKDKKGENFFSGTGGQSAEQIVQKVSKSVESKKKLSTSKIKSEHTTSFDSSLIIVKDGLAESLEADEDSAKGAKSTVALGNTVSIKSKTPKKVKQNKMIKVAGSIKLAVPSESASNVGLEVTPTKVEGLIGLGNETEKFLNTEFQPDMDKYFAEQGWDKQDLPTFILGYNGQQVQIKHNPKTTPEVYNQMMKFIQQKWKIGYSKGTEGIRKNQLLTKEEDA